LLEAYGVDQIGYVASGINKKPNLGEAMSTELKKLETAEVVAPLLGLSKQALYEAVRKDLIPAVWIGRRIRFDPEELAKWVAQGGKALEESEQ